MDFELIRNALKPTFDTACATGSERAEETEGYRMDGCGGGKGKGNGKGECKGKECDSCKKPSCDGCKVKDACGGGKKEPVTMDAAAAYAASDIASRAGATIQQWAETDDLEEGESYADRLMAMFVGIADSNKDGEITEDEADVIEAALNAGYDYLVRCGVSEEDAESLLNDWPAEVADRVRDIVAENLPDGEEAEGEDLDDFVFSDEENEPAMDSVLDAVYRKAFAIRGGKKMRINKRISGTVRLSAKQKVAIRKAQMKSHSAGAQMRRMKSMRLRKRLGLK